jgi:DNA-binding NtrC family response regulator
VNKKVLIVEDQFIEANDLQLILEKAGYKPCGIARSVPIAQELIKKEKPGLVLLDIFLKGKLTGIDLAKQLAEEDIPFVYLSANSNEEVLNAAKATQPYGFLVKPFREKDLLITLEIAQYRHEYSRESKLRRDTEIVQQLEQTITRNAGWQEKLLQIGRIVQQKIPFDYLAIGFDDPRNIASATSFLRIGFNEYQTIGVNELLTITGITMQELTAIQAASDKEIFSAFFNNEEFEKITQKLSLKKLFKEKFAMKSQLTLPLLLSNSEIFSFCFYSRRPDSYGPEQIATCHLLQQTLARSITLMRSTESISTNKIQLEEETEQMNNAAVSKTPGFEGIIGSSHLLLNVFDQITQVAPFDTSVLILGESGTGKERIADCIHKLSPRKGKALIKMNCAALPATLIESELFGHEKGSFTGATDKRIGKFAQANGGTIFLDEIGEMPVDLQVKLLRVLQEKEIEPIGGRSPVKIDVRIVAATNRNLEKEVAEGRFRLDLYYRLNVFPIELPPLRERVEDIPDLASHFVDYYSSKSGKKITGLSSEVLRSMATYSWPGNIRELENLIERSVLLSKGTIIEAISLSSVQKKDSSANGQGFQMKTIHENERDHIIAVLKKCKGRIWGAGGAAEVLNIPPSTLKSKMKKLGIQKESIE